MKRYLILLITLLSFSSVYSQRVDAGFNEGISVELGYSNVYNPVNKNLIEPKHLFNVDVTMFGFYAGFGVGSETLYHDRNCYETYSENLNTYIGRIGTSFRIGSWRTGMNITPYIGMLINSYSENIDEHGHYDYNYGYYPGYNYTLYEDTYDCKLIYGLKLSFNYDLFIIGCNLSNRDAGISIGIYLN